MKDKSQNLSGSTKQYIFFPVHIFFPMHVGRRGDFIATQGPRLLEEPRFCGLLQEEKREMEEAHKILGAQLRINITFIHNPLTGTGYKTQPKYKRIWET